MGFVMIFFGEGNVNCLCLGDLVIVLSNVLLSFVGVLFESAACVENIIFVFFLLFIFIIVDDDVFGDVDVDVVLYLIFVFLIVCFSVMYVVFFRVAFNVNASLNVKYNSGYLFIFFVGIVSLFNLV